MRLSPLLLLTAALVLPTASAALTGGGQPAPLAATPAPTLPTVPTGAGTGAGALPTGDAPAATAPAGGMGSVPVSVKPAQTYSLKFDPSRFTAKSVTVDGQTVRYRAYENVVYVAHPLDTTYQSMNIYMPEAYFTGGTVRNYTAQTAPIFFPNSVGGYMPGAPATTEETPRGGGTNALVQALARGYVVAAPGARGRTNVNETGEYIGKAPAAIVDLKAAVRYLRANDAAMPGSAERIVSNGTSAGGALSALLGASGNDPAFEPYLRALGAAQARDNIFAVSSYCPITNLEHADAAYEWLFQGIRDYSTISIQMLDYKVQRTETPGTLTDEQAAVSDDLAAQFPAYVNSLGLRSPQDARPLTLNADGSGPFADEVAEYLRQSAQRALDAGTDLSSVPWVQVQGSRVTATDLRAYAKAVGRQKTPPAFDALDLSSGENDLFGTQTVRAQHFTAYGQTNDTAGGTQADPATVALMNPMTFLSGTVPTAHWRIRHGTADRDTSLAVPTALATALLNKGQHVDFALAWGQGHGGNYDLPELFDWVDSLPR